MKSSLVQFLSTTNDDIKTEIVQLIKPTQWWYLNQTFEHNDCVYSVCFDPSGKLLATGSSDDKARIFYTQLNKKTISFNHNSYVWSVCFDSSGKLLATASSDRKARIFDLQHNKEIIYFYHNNSSVN